MRRMCAALLVVALTAIVSANTHVAVGSAALTAPPPTLHQCTTLVRSQVLNHNHLTIATDNPVYTPWFIKNTPTNKMGYESAMAYALAKQLGFSAKSVKWVVEPFANSYKAGSKTFDFDINEIAYNPTWAQNVSFSSSYYNVQQSLVAMKSDAIVNNHSAAQLPNYKYGALTGSPAYSYATKVIKPKIAVRSFATLPTAESALENGTIDALVIDTPTGNHVVTWDIVAANLTPLAKQVGQFPFHNDEYYGLVMQKNNPLLTCVNIALSALHHNGTVASLTQKWLTIYTKLPTLQP